MTIDNFIQKVQLLITDLQVTIPDYIGSKVAVDNIAIVKTRVEQKGQAADGGGFSPYSAYTAKKKKERGKSGVKNFSDTRQMWKSFKVTETVQQGDVFVTHTRMDDNTRNSGLTNQEIMEKHSKNEGKSIIDMSKTEIKNMETNVQTWTEKLIKQRLGL
jgi:hypothetical protein